MKANRKTMLGVALAVAVIALAGIGYAAAKGYTAQTDSASNDISTEYITIKLADVEDDDNANLKASSIYQGLRLPIEFNTKTTYEGSAEKVYYQMKSTGNLTMQFKILLPTDAMKNVPSTDTFQLTVTGLVAPTIPGATGTWSFSVGGSTIANQTLTANGTYGQLNNGILTFTVSPTTAGNPAENVWSETVPGTNGVIEIGTLHFLLTNTTEAA